jgi:DNA invertase Pin-like site-specific DNA recombinase
MQDGVVEQSQVLQEREMARVGQDQQSGAGDRCGDVLRVLATAQGRLVFHIFGALAEFERSLIRERNQAGLAAVRRLGRTGGRPPKLTDEDIEAAKALLANPEIGVTQIAHRLGVSPATLYRYIPAARTANTPGV